MEIDLNKIDVVHNTEKNRFEMQIGDQIAMVKVSMHLTPKSPLRVQRGDFEKRLGTIRHASHWHTFRVGE